MLIFIDGSPMEMVGHISYQKLCRYGLPTHSCLTMSHDLFADGKHPACDHSYFGRREFSFTLENDIYIRFQSFNNAVDMENSIREKCPYKIDIGPVYSVDV